MLGRVIGQAVAPRKHIALDGYRLLFVKPYGLYEPSHAVDLVVAVDVVGAGPGEDVVVCFGEPARRCSRQAYHGAVDLPVDAAVMAIVDRAQLDASVVSGLLRPLGFDGPPPACIEWV